MNDLQLFFAAYWQWVMEGAPEGKPFNRGHDLSGALTDYAYKHGLSLSGTQIDYRSLLAKEGLDPLNPFNDGVHQPAFPIESKLGRCYLNGARLNFVHKHKGN